MAYCTVRTPCTTNIFNVRIRHALLVIPTNFCGRLPTHTPCVQYPKPNAKPRPKRPSQGLRQPPSTMHAKKTEARDRATELPHLLLLVDQAVLDDLDHLPQVRKHGATHEDSDLNKEGSHNTHGHKNERCPQDYSRKQCPFIPSPAYGNSHGRPSSRQTLLRQERTHTHIYKKCHATHQ